MKTKTSMIKDALTSGDMELAIKLASKLPRLGNERNAILDARLAYTNPRFMVQIGKDIEATISIGHTALINKFLKD